MWSFEKRFVPDEEISDGPFHKTATNKIWLIICCILMLTLFGPLFYSNTSTLPQIWFVYITLPILARLITLDLKYLILPDVYTIPLCLIAINHNMVSALIAFLLSGGSLILLGVLLEKYNKQSNIGGGDIKLTFAAGAFVGIFNLHYFFWLAFFFAIIFYPLLKAKNKHISFGPALAFSLWVIIIWNQMFLTVLS
jgi:leader peptidase (prepilin peptidase)/N-methyltransferase